MASISAGISALTAAAGTSVDQLGAGVRPAGPAPSPVRVRSEQGACLDQRPPWPTAYLTRSSSACSVAASTQDGSGRGYSSPRPLLQQSQLDRRLLDHPTEPFDLDVDLLPAPRPGRLARRAGLGRGQRSQRPVVGDLPHPDDRGPVHPSLGRGLDDRGLTADQL